MSKTFIIALAIVLVSFITCIVSFIACIWHEESELSGYRDALRYNCDMKIKYRDSLAQLRIEYKYYAHISDSLINDCILQRAGAIVTNSGRASIISGNGNVVNLDK